MLDQPVRPLGSESTSLVEDPAASSIPQLSPPDAGHITPHIYGVIHHDRVVGPEATILGPIHGELAERVQAFPGARLRYAIPAEVTHIRVKLWCVNLV